MIRAVAITVANISVLSIYDSVALHVPIAARDVTHHIACGMQCICLSHRWYVQKRLNWSRCHFVSRLVHGPKEPLIRLDTCIWVQIAHWNVNFWEAGCKGGGGAPLLHPFSPMKYLISITGNLGWKVSDHTFTCVINSRPIFERLTDKMFPVTAPPFGDPVSTIDPHLKLDMLEPPLAIILRIAVFRVNCVICVTLYTFSRLSRWQTDSHRRAGR